MINLLYTSSCSACFEWDNKLCYYTDKPYTVTLDGKAVYSGNTNVFSLFELKPHTCYTLGVEGYDIALKFTTANESCCFSAQDFFAVGDGVADDTVALQTAINCLPKNGRLKLKKGVYKTAPLTLKSDITLELEEGAVILGVEQESRYPVIPGEIVDDEGNRSVCGSWEGVPACMHQALIFAEHACNINIVGRGVIDGNAQNSTWWQNVKMRKIGRPRLCFLNHCKNVTFHGITGQNSASWQFHPYYCDKTNFLDICVNAPKNSPNTDGLNPESCDKVDIVGCHFSVGDDCIAIKSGKIYMAKNAKYRRSANRYTVRNCFMENGHGAITLGSEMSCGVTNLTANRCIFSATDRGLRIKSRRGRGKWAVIDNVLFENIQMDNVLTPIVINSFYFCCEPDCFSEYVWSRQKLPIDDRTPYLGHFCFRNMVCNNCHVAATYCMGLPECPIEEITLENITFSFSKNAQSDCPAMASFVPKMSKAGMYFEGVKQLNISNVTLDGVVGEHLVSKNIGNVRK